jgi:hypothetical protein
MGAERTPPVLERRFTDVLVAAQRTFDPRPLTTGNQWCEYAMLKNAYAAADTPIASTMLPSH